MKEDINYYKLDSDDIVFDSRNKHYGAYLLRKKYTKNLLKALVASVFVTVVALLTPKILEALNFFEEAPEEILIRRDINLADAPPAIAQTVSKASNTANGELEAVKKEEAQQEKKTTDPTKPDNKSAGTDTTGNYKKNGDGKNGKNDGGKGNDIYDIGKVQVKPIFKGGDEAYVYFFEDNLIHPNRRLSGTIFVSFIIEKNGDITDIHTDGKGNPQLEIAAKECIAKMKGQWIPAKQGGQNVRVICKVPVEF